MKKILISSLFMLSILFIASSVQAKDRKHKYHHRKCCQAEAISIPLYSYVTGKKNVPGGTVGWSKKSRTTTKRIIMIIDLESMTREELIEVIKMLLKEVK